MDIIHHMIILCMYVCVFVCVCVCVYFCVCACVLVLGNISVNIVIVINLLNQFSELNNILKTGLSIYWLSLYNQHI